MKIDPYSATWLVMKEHLDQRAAELRAKLESNCGFEEVIATRAVLREIKQLLNMVVPEESPLIPTHLDIPS